MLNISKKQVYSLLNSGALEAVDIAKEGSKRCRYRFEESSVISLLERRKVSQKGK